MTPGFVALADLMPLGELGGPLHGTVLGVVERLEIGDITFDADRDDDVGVGDSDEPSDDDIEAADPGDDSLPPATTGSAVDALGEDASAVVSFEGTVPEEPGVPAQTRLTLTARLPQETEIPVPGLEQMALVLAPGGVEVVIATAAGYEVSVTAGLGLRFPAGVLTPVHAVTDGSGATRYEPDPLRSSVTLQVGTATLTFDQDGRFAVDGGLQVGLTEPAMIGSTGVVIVAAHCALDLGVSRPRVALDATEVVLPDGLPVPGGRVVLDDVVVGPTGLSGRAAIDLDLRYDPVARRFEYLPAGGGSPEPAEILGLSGGLRHVAVEIEQNQLVGCDVAGSLVVPYFDEPVDITIGFTPDLGVLVGLSDPGGTGIRMTKEELLALRITALTAGAGSLTVSGSLEPLLLAGDGMTWPRLDVTDLEIDSQGRFRIGEAWLDLESIATLDLYGFQLELSRIGLGSRDADDRLWIDLSGSLRLLEQIPVGLGVEGFRLTWPRTVLDQLGIDGPASVDDVLAIAGAIDVEFDGVHLFFGVPDAVEFEGLIRFFKNEQIAGFAGDVALRVPAAGFAAEAGLLVGMSAEPPFPFLYVYFGVELPAGIPLAQSGLALKGAMGLVGLNVAPDKAPAENWYYDWYKRGPIVGAHPTTKWAPERDALSIGMGLTITTVDGYVKGTRGLLVLAVPGPILIIEGRALILDGLAPAQEPPLRALAVLDGEAGTAQFTIEAEATLIEDMIEASGTAEAFFDFLDLTNWHLYLGQDEPRDRRVRAQVLKLGDAFLFDADAYLMIDMVGAGTTRARMGVHVGFAPEIPDAGPVSIAFDATVDGDGVVTVRPEQFSGDIAMSAGLVLSAFGFDVQLTVDADMLVEGVDPLSVGAGVRATAELPWPLDPIEVAVDLAWQSQRTPPLEPPLAEVVVSSRFAPSGGSFREDSPDPERLVHAVPVTGSPGTPDLAQLRSVWQELAENSPVVPVDAQPIIAFRQRMNAPSDGFARHPDGSAEHYDLGIVRFTPELSAVRLYRHRPDARWTGDDSDWEIVGSSDPAGGAPLPGVWLAESDPASPAVPSARRVQLWTDNPLSNAGRAIGAGYSRLLGAVPSGRSDAEGLLQDHPDLMRCTSTTPEPVCVDFRGSVGTVIEVGQTWEHEGLRISVSAAASVRTVSRTRACLLVADGLHLHFPRPVRTVRIVLCEPTKHTVAQVEGGLRARRSARTLAELARLRDTARAEGGPPDLRACIADVDASVTGSDREWLIEAAEGFDCLSLTRLPEIAVREVCYVSAEEWERAERAEEQCRGNTTPPGNPTTLEPGTSYRLDVATRVGADLRYAALPFERDTFLGELLVAGYELIMDDLQLGDGAPPHPFHQVVFFRTEAPPRDLRPYVASTSPAAQAERFFHGDDLAIRLLRPNVKEMFSDERFGLRVEIRDAQEKQVDGFDVTWRKAASGTPFVEEAVWAEHRDSLGWPAVPPPLDDILLISRATDGDTPGLAPGARYRLRIRLDGTGTAPADRDEDLYSLTFTTSMFGSFAELVSSYRGEANAIPAADRYLSGLSMIDDVRRSGGILAKAERDWERARIDYGFAALDGGRVGLEAHRLARREAAAAHDAGFRALAERLSDLHYRPFAPELEVHVVRDPDSGAAVCAWVRSPESLDFVREVLADPEDDESPTVDTVGRTRLRLHDADAGTDISHVTAVHDVDSRQLLLFAGEGAHWAQGTYMLTLSYQRDLGDASADIDHRYDRPVEYRDGSSAVDEAHVTWSL